MLRLKFCDFGGKKEADKRGAAAAAKQTQSGELQPAEVAIVVLTSNRRT